MTSLLRSFLSNAAIGDDVTHSKCITTRKVALLLCCLLPLAACDPYARYAANGSHVDVHRGIDRYEVAAQSGLRVLAGAKLTPGKLRVTLTIRNEQHPAILVDTAAVIVKNRRGQNLMAGERNMRVSCRGQVSGGVVRLEKDEECEWGIAIFDATTQSGRHLELTQPSVIRAGQALPIVVVFESTSK